MVKWQGNISTVYLLKFFDDYIMNQTLISDPDVRQLKTTMRNNPLLTSGKVFTMAELRTIVQNTNT